MAGARVPLILSTSRYLLFSMKEKKELSKSSLFDQIERLAHHRDPRAMQLQAQILGRRGKYNEAIALMEEVLGMIWPSKVDAPTPGDEYMVSQYMLKPWEVYAWLKEKVGDPTGADEVTRVAAFEYEDPKALMKYAPIMLRAEKFDEYEECMSKAASSGNAMACLKLANFYFLTSQGFYARRGVKASGLDPMPSTVTTATVVTTTRNPTSRGPIEEKPAGKLASFFSFLFSDVKTHEEYRKLAMDWYELAYNHGSLSAAFFLAVLLREDGDHELALQFLQHVQMPEGRDAFLKQLKAQWHDKSFHLAVPIHLFDH
jgi:tetratricopeptide (TPR) repeat protein